MRKSLLAILFLMTLPAAAHHVGYEVDRGEAVVVSLAYGNGSPLAFDRYEIIAEGEETPYQSGITDAMGRIVFLPDRTSSWRVRVFSEDGHGADFTFEAGPAEPPAAGPDAAKPEDEAAQPEQEPVNTLTPEVVEAEKKRLVERFAGPVFGVGIILSAFALFSLFARRRR
jgi:nickel transport protein